MKLLRIYLDDHRAGAAAGTALAERLAAENADLPWGSDLAWIADQIRDDHRALAGVRRDLGFHGGVLKKAVAIVGERVGRLKP
ncbi:MAG TPA: hypothetical protein VFT85_00465, partial [Acidimicrobiia bacterium]|nr:hypothetical protein [Acidimicrobiia bacterium]